MLYNSSTDIESLKIFVAKVLFNESPDNKCFVICYILSVYLSLSKVNHVLKSGMIRISNKVIPHYIIALQEGKLDIDPTAHQINPSNPQVLVKKGLYANLHFKKTSIDTTYTEWEYPLMNDGYRKPLPELLLQSVTPQTIELGSQKVDIAPYLRLLITGYFALKEEISVLGRKGQHVHLEYAEIFFDRVKNVAIQNKDKRGKLGSVLADNKFTELLGSVNC